MKKTAAVSFQKTLLSCIYGPGKVGKTTIALGAPPEWRPMAILDTDFGLAQRLHLLSQTPEARKARNVVEKIPDHFGPWIKEGLDIYTPDKGPGFYNQLWEFASRIAKDYKLVVVDSLSRLADSMLDEVESTEFKGSGRVKIPFGNAQQSTVHPSPADYGFAQDRAQTFINMLDDSPAHLLILSHERANEIKDKENNVIRVVAGPRATGNQLTEVLPAMVDVLLHLQVRPKVVEGVRQNVVIVRSKHHDEIFPAGDRSGLFPDGEVLDVAALWQRFAAIVAAGGSE